MLLLGQYNCDFYWFYFCSCFSKQKKYKNGYFMILLWDFHDTSCKFIRKVSFLYITIYQVNTILFSLRMRLWDFFLKNNCARKWYYSHSCDCFRMKYKERGWGLQIPRGKWSNIFWQRIANPPERLAGDFLIVRWTNNATPKRAVFWFKSTITTI